eukprot:2811498-Prorocentrum_lima.AAC.1
MRAHFIHDLLGANLWSIEYIPSQENPADALTKGFNSCSPSQGKAVAVLGRNGSMTILIRRLKRADLLISRRLLTSSVSCGTTTPTWSIVAGT